MSLNATQLLDLEPMPYRLGYGIPLIILSTLVCFAGAFLTLDRTWSFAPMSVGRKQTVVYRLEGGIGGLIIGWAFGLHLVTFMALVVSNKTNAAPIGVISFLVVWAICGIVTGVLGGRSRYAALVMAGILGGAALSLGATILIHPPLLARRILLAIFIPILTAAVLIPTPRIRRPAMRFAAACAGAFGITLGGAVVGALPGWANVWDRLWMAQSVEWGGKVENGLSAMFWILCILGTASNWFLRRQFGENPDQKWDAWLANYAANLPSRAGSFEPPKSLVQKLFKNHDPLDNLEEGENTQPFNSPLQQGKLRTKSRGRVTSGGGGVPVKFQPLAQDVSDTDSEDELDKKVPLRPFGARTSTSGSSVTAVSERSRGKLPKTVAEENVDYSDAEGLPMLKRRQSRDIPGWKPAFLARSETGDSATIGNQHPRPPVPPGAVAATPSLLNAIDRIHRAQASVYGGQSTSGAQTPRPESPRSDAGPGGWQGFWADVQAKAAEPDNRPKP
ncbi:hypothetical protein BKA62DRAFT_828489 [Auriculariales sp. MPI-PUGE-AT-0066]|nr:hypothetical protein BKA62DRAFT_828489 [Auriculariales sp. MPI-PUGE-AT-0066]